MPIARVVDGAISEFRDIALSDVPEHKRGLWRAVEYEGSGPTQQTIIEENRVRIVRSYTREQMQARVNAERDRRISKFTFNGVVYDYDPTSSDRIDKARGSALAAIIAGAQPGNLRWADPEVDFGWIAANNSFTLMDAPTTLAFGNAAAAWEGLHIVAARTLKDMTNIPEDYANDSYWPTA